MVLTHIMHWGNEESRPYKYSRLDIVPTENTSKYCTYIAECVLRSSSHAGQWWPAQATADSMKNKLPVKIMAGTKFEECLKKIQVQLKNLLTNSKKDFTICHFSMYVKIHKKMSKGEKHLEPFSV